MVHAVTLMAHEEIICSALQGRVLRCVTTRETLSIHYPRFSFCRLLVSSAPPCRREILSQISISQATVNLNCLKPEERMEWDVICIILNSRPYKLTAQETYQASLDWSVWIGVAVGVLGRSSKLQSHAIVGVTW